MEGRSGGRRAKNTVFPQRHHVVEVRICGCGADPFNPGDLVCLQHPSIACADVVVLSQGTLCIYFGGRKNLPSLVLFQMGMRFSGSTLWLAIPDGSVPVMASWLAS